MDDHIQILLLIAVATGVAGGLVSYYGLRNNREAGSGDAPLDRYAIQPVIRGVAAALVTPLFLEAISSELLKRDADPGTQQLRYLLFGATSLLAAISSRAFINNVSQRLLNEAAQAGATAGKEAAREETAPLKHDAEENRAAIESNRSDIDVLAAAKANPGMLGGPPPKTVAPNLPASRSMARKPVWESDPHKGMFGGESRRGEWSLDASVTPRGSSNTFFDVMLRVTGPKDKAGSYVEFHLHPTFSPEMQTAQLDGNGSAELDLVAMGAFTVGVRVLGVNADNSDLELELDLAKLESAPKEFRDR